MPLRDWLQLLGTGLPTERDISIVHTLLSQTKAAIEQFSAPERRAEYRDRWARLTQSLLDASPAGGDLQLAYARAYAATARTDEHAAVLRGWLSEGSAPLGLAIDTDLRWTLLQRLLALGAAAPAEVDAELERDNTASGHRQAATARALVPTMEAKEAAFAATVEGDDLPNALLTATVAGFASADARELHRAFLDRYFDAIPEVWAERTNETAQTIVLGFYPAQLVEQSTLDITDRFLARDDIPPGARRLVREGRDGIERSLRCQARDAS
jgi:aminopeptidase N